MLPLSFDTAKSTSNMLRPSSDVAEARREKAPVVEQRAATQATSNDVRPEEEVHAALVAAVEPKKRAKVVPELQLSPELLAAAAEKIEVPSTLRQAPHASNDGSKIASKGLMDDEVWRDFFDKEIYQKMAEAPTGTDAFSSDNEDLASFGSGEDTLSHARRGSGDSSNCADEMAAFW